MATSPFDHVDRPSSDPPDPAAASAAAIDGAPLPHVAAELTSEPLPPLRLHHLFSLTAVVAIVLAISGPQRAAALQTRLPNQRFLIGVMQGAGVLYTVLASTAVTIVAYSFAWRRNGIRLFHQPGHWLLVMIALSLAYSSTWQLIARTVMGDQQNLNPTALPSWLWAYYILYLAALLVGVALNLFIALKKCDTWRWKAVFIVRAISIIPFVDVLLLVLLLRTGFVERREGPSRDVLHRYGLWLQVALSTLTVFLTAFSIAMMFVTFITAR